MLREKRSCGNDIEAHKKLKAKKKVGIIINLAPPKKCRLYNHNSKVNSNDARQTEKNTLHPMKSRLQYFFESEHKKMGNTRTKCFPSFLARIS